ncbi:MAG: hypothetical protein HW410_419 [Nitrosarchaeum sp.]|nr:hypothetical protein [Nitrosarchaeum sp.]
MLKTSKIFLYDEPTVSQIQLERLATFLKEIFLIQVETRESISKLSKEDTAEKIAACRILNPIKPYERHKPTIDEIRFEESLIPKEETSIDLLHIFFTNKLTCTYDYEDFRYHGRALIGANPSIISITGIIEAPAKPREYYIELISHAAQNANIESIKQKYRGDFLEYNDSRLSKIIEGYLLQEIFYFETGEPFCDKKECRLYNAHWQKDLLYSQLESGKLCDKHQQVLKKLVI